jgi:hypothetical protein
MLVSGRGTKGGDNMKEHTRRMRIAAEEVMLSFGGGRWVRSFLENGNHNKKGIRPNV